MLEESLESFRSHLQPLVDWRHRQDRRYHIVAGLRRKRRFRPVLRTPPGQSLERESVAGRLDLPDRRRRRYFFNPIVVDELMYVWARTIRWSRWMPRPGKRSGRSPRPDTRIITKRGINYWESKDRTDRRLIFARNHSCRRSTRAPASRSSPSATAAAWISNKVWGAIPTLSLIQSMTPGRVFEDLIVLGSATNRDTVRRPGICARTTRSPASWSGRFTPSRVPASSDTTPGRRTPEDVGGANVWGEITARCEARYRVRPTGVPTTITTAPIAGGQPVRRLPARARCADGQAAVAFPDGAS